MNNPLCLRAAVGGLAITAALALAACSTSTASTSGSEDGSLAELSEDTEVEIVFESYNLATAGVWTDTITALLDEFMADNPNITVVGQPLQGSSTGASVQQQMVAGDPPDIAQLAFGELDFAATTLGSQNLTDLVGSAALEEQFGGEYPYHPRAAVLADWNGATYGLPYTFSTPILWINETMFDDAGLDPATVDLSTWDAVQEAGEAITENTGMPSVGISCVMTGGNWCMQGVFLSNGAQVLSEDRTTIEFGSDAAIETVEVFRQMADAGVLSNDDGTSQWEAFAQTNLAMHMNSSALQGMFMGAAEEGGWTLGNTGMPAFGEQPVVPTNSGSYLAMFSTDPDKQAAAWKLMQWMTSPTAYESITTQIGYLPLRTTMTQEGGPLYEWVQGNPLVEPNLQQLDELEPWVSYPGDSFIQVDQILATAIEDSVFYGADPAETMSDAAERAQELID